MVLAALVAIPARTPGQTTPSLLDAVRKAAPQRVDGPIPTHFSPGAEQRARDLQGVLVNALAFYRERLGVAPAFTLALLDPPAWKGVTGDAVPYGLPFVNGPPPVMVLPFRQEGAIVTGYMAAASRLWEIVSRSDAGNTAEHRSLADFERLYMGVGADNYIWYQGRFSERVFAVFAIERLDFLRKVKDAFPRQPNEKLTPDQVLERLEKVRPGFNEWAMSLQAPAR